MSVPACSVLHWLEFQCQFTGHRAAIAGGAAMLIGVLLVIGPLRWLINSGWKPRWPR